MITEAVLYFATPEDAAAALLAVSGRPLAFRMLMAAVRAGCRRVCVPARFRGSAVERAIAASPSARTAAAWLDEEAPPPEGTVLLLPVAALVPAAALRPMLGAPPNSVLVPSRSGDAPVVAAGPGLLGGLWTRIAAGHPLGQALDQTLDRSAATAGPNESWYVRVASRRTVAEAEARLYAGLGSPIDTRLDRLVHRRLSRPLSRLAVRWGVSPNAVTLASLGIGLGAVWGFWHASPASALFGLLLYVVAVVLDHVDGEVARLTLAESRLGEWLDVAVDTVIHAALVVALGVTAERAAGGGGALVGLIAAGGVVASAAMTKTSPPVGRAGLGGVLDALGNRDGFYGTLVGFLVALAVWPAALPVLMLVVAAGSHAFWVGRLGYRLAGDRGSARGPGR